MASNGDPLKQVKDFRYLGTRMESTERHQGEKSSMEGPQHLTRGLKTRIFVAAIETILLYSCEAWTLTAALTKSLGGGYTRMLQVVFNISWQ